MPHPRAARFLPVAPLALPCGRASGSVCLLPPRPCPRRRLERHGFCPLSIAETEQPRQDALCGRWGEATGPFLSERDTHGHIPPSHNIRPHRGPLPLAVGEGIPPLEHEGAQVEVHQECSASLPWALGRGA